MISNAVTASMCASASEVAFLVASLMPFLPGDWTRLFVAQITHATSAGFLLGTPLPRRPLCESPLGVGRWFQDRLVMRRQLGSLMLLLRRSAGNVWAINNKNQ